MTYKPISSEESVIREFKMHFDLPFTTELPFLFRDSSQVVEQMGNLKTSWPCFNYHTS